MREKAKELQKQRLEAAKSGKRPAMTGFGRTSNGYDGISSESSRYIPPSASGEPAPVASKPSISAPKAPSGPSRALKLGGKGKDADSFVDQLKSEGDRMMAAPKPGSGGPKGVKKAPEIERTEP